MSRLPYPLPQKIGYQGRKLPRDLVRRIVDLAHAGHDLHEIARRSGLGWSSIRDILVPRGFFRASTSPDEHAKFRQEQARREAEREAEAQREKERMEDVDRELARARVEAETVPLSKPLPVVEIDVPADFYAQQDHPLCRRGHVRSPSNVNEQRQCIECYRAQQAEYQRRRRGMLPKQPKQPRPRALPRRSISIRGETHDRLAQYCHENGLSVSGLVEVLIAEQLREDEPCES